MFVAEFGDKTMLATATLAAKDNPVYIWIGATIGIILAGTLGAVVGNVFGARLPDRVLRIGSAVMFFVFGVILIATSVWTGRGDPGRRRSPTCTTSRPGRVRTGQVNLTSRVWLVPSARVIVSWRHVPAHVRGVAHSGST